MAQSELWNPAFGSLTNQDQDGQLPSSNNSRNQEKVTPVPPSKIYKRRWYILFVYSTMCMGFAMSMTALNPIADAIKKAYCWTNADVALLSAWVPLSLIFTSVFFSWILDTKGLRISFTFAASTLVIGAGIRCLPAISASLNWCLHLGTIILGLSSTAAIAGCTTVSNTWFPPNQRTLATSIANIGMTVGFGTASILSPLLVPLQDNATNSSATGNNSTNEFNCSLGEPYSSEHNLAELRNDIMKVMYIAFGFASLIWLAIVVYFPSKPPTPPSVSASSERTNFFKGIKTIFKKPAFWMISFVIALGFGPSTGLGFVLDVDLEAAKVPGDQIVSGTLSIGSLFCSTFTSLGISILADRYRKYVKYFILSVIILGLGAFTWFALIVQGVAPASYASLYISYITGQTALLTPFPVYMEIACDAVYPVAEGLTTAFANIPLSLAVVFFLFVFFIPNVGTLWMNWLVVGAGAVCIPILICFTPSAGRLSVDKKEHTEDKRQLVQPKEEI